MGEKKKKRVAILTGGSIDLAFARDYLKTYQATVILAVDKGLAAAVQLA